jgi:hypothetical protein
MPTFDISDAVAAMRLLMVVVFAAFLVWLFATFVGAPRTSTNTSLPKA